MGFELATAPVAVRPEIPALFAREWRRLSGPGATWSGAERLAIAAASRRARDDGPPGAASLPEPASLPPAATEAAATIAASPAAPRRQWVEEIATEIGYPAYVEIVGVVARLASVDGFHRALGLSPPRLPEPRSGAPTGRIDDRARLGAAWVPMVGGASIVHALSLVPEEFAAQEDMHGPMYLSYEGMSDLAFRRGLTRAQMELVAARVSAVNECFY